MIAKITTTLEVPIIHSKKDLVRLKEDARARKDFHEPDEQGLAIKYSEGSFDNAMNDETEASIVIFQDGRPIGLVNIAMLLAWATGYVDED